MYIYFAYFLFSLYIELCPIALHIAGRPCQHQPCRREIAVRLYPNNYQIKSQLILDKNPKGLFIQRRKDSSLHHLRAWIEAACWTPIRSNNYQWKQLRRKDRWANFMLIAMKIKSNNDAKIAFFFVLDSKAILMLWFESRLVEFAVGLVIFGYVLTCLWDILRRCTYCFKFVRQ